MQPPVEPPVADGPLAQHPPRPASHAEQVESAGLYAVLGLTPEASDPQIQAAYRLHAARLAGGGTRGARALRQLNMAYGILGNPARRLEYDRTLDGTAPPMSPAAWGTDSRRAEAPLTGQYPHLRRARRIAAPAGSPELLAVLVVMALTLAVAAVLIQRVEVDLSAVSAAGSFLGLGSPQRRLPLEAAAPAPTAVAPAATPAALSSPTPAVPLATQFRESTVTASNARPAQNSLVSVVARLRRNGQPAAGVDVWLTARYRTITERWPPAGTVKTDQTGTATITFNVGDATPGFLVQVEVFGVVDGQRLSWPASFTPG